VAAFTTSGRCGITDLIHPVPFLTSGTKPGTTMKLESGLSIASAAPRTTRKWVASSESVVLDHVAAHRPAGLLSCTDNLRGLREGDHQPRSRAAAPHQPLLLLPVLRRATPDLRIPDWRRRTSAASARSAHALSARASRVSVPVPVFGSPNVVSRFTGH
jgi:hypothetical protein